MKKIKYILASLLAITSLAAHATLRMPDITVTKITALGVTSNVGFKVKDGNEWLKTDAKGNWMVTSTDTPVQGAIGEKDYSGFFFQPENSYSGSTSTPYYHFTYTLADINDPANGIVVDPTTTGGTLLAPRRGPSAVPTDYFLIQASTSNTTLYVIIYNGKVYGTADIEKATKFEAYQLAYADHNVSCVQTALDATCEEGGRNAVYQCSICQKYFKEQTCETETTLADEEIPALGHDYQVVKDHDTNPKWVWADDKSTAKLEICCQRNSEHWDSQNVTSTSEVTTLPTTESEGVLTYTAKVTYNGEKYVSTAEATIPMIPAVNTTTITNDITPENNSVTVIAATTESVTETHTITAPNKGTANIVLAGGTEGAAANVNVSVQAGTTINITSSGTDITTIKGDISVAEGGTINLSNVKVEGKLSGDVNVKENTSLDITDATVDGKIYAADATVVAGAANIEGLTVNNDGKQVASSVNLADAAASCPIEFTVPGDKVDVKRQLISDVSGTMMLSCTVPVSEIRGAKIYSFSGVKSDMSGVDMTEVATGNLEAFKPYCVVPSTDKITFAAEATVTFPKTPSVMGAEEKNDWKFVAVNQEITWKAGNSALGTVYGFAGETKNGIEAGTFVMAAAGASAAPGRSILTATSGATTQQSGAKGINGSASSELPSSIKVYFHNANETTGIATLNTETGEMTSVQWYDLNGRRIDEPTKSGIYIKGNKKVMVK